jgi:serine/threonine-protein kinase
VDSVKIGVYEILGELGRGAMGVVYRARMPDGRAAALKVLFKQDEGAFARFDRERRLLSALGEKEGFVGLLDSGTSPHGPWLVMPFVPGGTLRQRLEDGPLAVEETIELGIELGLSLGRAHARGIVHRDVKPENVLFSGAGRPLLADLGLAKHFDPEAKGASQSVALTKTGVFKGTAGYTAPEQVEDSSRVGPAADVFALGAVLYECLSGKPAFEGAHLLDVLARLTSGELEPLERPDLPRWLWLTLLRAVETDPAKRFADGASLAFELRDRGRSRAGKAKLALLGLALLAVLHGLGFLVWHSISPSTTAAKAPVPSLSTGPPGKDVPADVEGRLPPGLRAAERNVPAADGKEVPLYLWGLPDGSEMEMVQVPSGEFVMGADDADAYDNEKPRHAHTLARVCWIGRNPVTREQYLAFLKTSGGPEPDKPYWWDLVPGAKPDLPVVNVTWEDAYGYCFWAGLALPTEAEWERAARGTDGRKFPWGDEWDPGERCNFADASCPLDKIDFHGQIASDVFKERGADWDREHKDGHPFVSPVGSYPRGVSPVGALDMAGNVWQWCADWFDAGAYARYKAGHRTPPAPAKDKVSRGGSFFDAARSCRSAYRVWSAPTYKEANVGFRAVLRPR